MKLPFNGFSGCLHPQPLERCSLGWRAVSHQFIEEVVASEPRGLSSYLPGSVVDSRGQRGIIHSLSLKNLQLGLLTLAPEFLRPFSNLGPFCHCQPRKRLPGVTDRNFGECRGPRALESSAFDSQAALGTSISCTWKQRNPMYSLAFISTFGDRLSSGDMGSWCKADGTLWKVNIYICKAVSLI